ncbi:MAG TPA: DUF4124 domain-containing protein [Rhodanobacter sp.]|nr:DUF4124 domain-containing protein [Rhodanobacter sp.]
MHRLLIAVALLLLAPLATAQVYKWTDAKGTVHYSEAPPTQGTKFSKISTTGTVEPLAKSAAPANRENSSDGSHESRPAPTPVADTPANRKSLCDSLQSNLATLHGSAPVVMEKDGKPNALDATQRQQQVDTAQAQYEQYCQAK